MTPPHYALLALAAGIGIPIMASISSTLGLRLASTSTAAAILFLGAFIITLTIAWINTLPDWQAFSSTPLLLYSGGIFVAFYIISITWLVPKFGIGNAIFFVLLGQIISASLIDHYGILNTVVVPLSTQRLTGILLMIIGLFLARQTHHLN